MANHAAGTFNVNVKPIQADGDQELGRFARLSIDKQYHGALEGPSRGQMLAAETAVAGSGAYVAMERFDGTLDGRKGGFVLQHNGTMAGGVYDLSVSVVPDSGTDELAGISGTLRIVIEGKEHRYEFDYSIPA